MLAALGAIFLSALLVGVGDLLIGRWTRGQDSAWRVGVAGLIGLAALGFIAWLLAFAGIHPKTSSIIATLGCVVSGIWQCRSRWTEAKFSLPSGSNRLFLLALGAAVLMSLVGAAGPSSPLDWDTLAYHLAVPQKWLDASKMHPIDFIHHSNFPYLVDSLFMVGLALGGAAMAKGFMAAFLLAGAVAVFGFSRQQWGVQTGWWSTLAFAAIPTVMWESGTAYIDVAHGLYAGLGTLLVARWISDPTRRQELWLGSILLGCAVASKYTGLQSVAACALVLVIYGFASRRLAESLKAASIMVGISLAIGAPWFAKNVAWTGNPVYPFFFERFGGANWDQFAADIYREEQQTFGVGRVDGKLSPIRFGHAVLGLAYQPGRYNNPRQTEGGGFPIGALGIVPIAGAVAWALSGRLRREEAGTLAVMVVAFAMWFVLSQQSRYLLNLGIPMAILAGAGVIRLRAGPFLAALICGQFAYSAWLVYTLAVAPKLPVVLGTKSLDSFHREQGPSFYFAAKRIDELTGKSGKVALYDEVFGVYLKTPYVWANPGHSTKIPYASISNGQELAENLKASGVNWVYLSLAYQAPEQRQRWLEAAGLIPEGRPYESEEREVQTADLRNKWRVLLAESVRSGHMHLVEQAPGGLIFRLGTPSAPSQ